MFTNLFLLVLAVTVCPSATASAKDYDLWPDGNDDRPGTAAQPFATLQRAPASATCSA